MMKNNFDKVAPYYNRFMNLFNLYKLAEIKTIADPSPNDIILDVGGGTGQLAEYLSTICHLIYILDESEHMLSEVNKNDKMICIQGNALKTPFQANTFDQVILSDVFHHIQDQKALLIEIHRILKPHGKLIIMDFDRQHLKTKLLRLFEFMLFGKLYFKTKSEIISLLGDSYELINSFEAGYYFILKGEKI